MVTLEEILWRVVLLFALGMLAGAIGAAIYDQQNKNEDEEDPETTSGSPLCKGTRDGPTSTDRAEKNSRGRTPAYESLVYVCGCPPKEALSPQGREAVFADPARAPLANDHHVQSHEAYLTALQDVQYSTGEYAPDSYGTYLSAVEVADEKTTWRECRFGAPVVLNWDGTVVTGYLTSLPGRRGDDPENGIIHFPEFPEEKGSSPVWITTLSLAQLESCQSIIIGREQ